jgi:hypothetical protein
MHRGNVGTITNLLYTPNIINIVFLVVSLPPHLYPICCGSYQATSKTNSSVTENVIGESDYVPAYLTGGSSAGVAIGILVFLLILFASGIALLVAHMFL